MNFGKSLIIASVSITFVIGLYLQFGPQTINLPSKVPPHASNTSVPVKPPVPPAPQKKQMHSTTTQISKKPVSPAQAPGKTPRPDNEFIIPGLLSTAGEPWAANSILVKILWLKNKKRQQFLLGKETGMVKAGNKGFVYRIHLKPQTRDYLNWNGGVEGNVGRIVAFLDKRRDGRLDLKNDRIIAVSKELVRYRTGRFDTDILNEIQQQNIKRAGKGYVIVRNMQIGDGKLDWKVIAQQSPARLDLSAAETSLPAMYNTFLRLHHN